MSMEPNLDMGLSAHQRSIVTLFYIDCMAQRMGLSFLVVLIALLRFTYNSPFFSYGEANFPSNSYTLLLEFCMAMFIVEWFVSTIVTIVIRATVPGYQSGKGLRFGMDAITVGANFLQNPQARILAFLFCSHVMMDSVMILNKGEVYWD